MTTASSRAKKGSGRGRRKRINLKALRDERKRVAGALHAMKIGDFYKPLKKPVTLRLDADVIAWFKAGISDADQCGPARGDGEGVEAGVSNPDFSRRKRVRNLPPGWRTGVSAPHGRLANAKKSFWRLQDDELAQV